MFYSNDALRDSYIRSGPYNYPVGIIDNSVVLGDIYVTVSSGSMAVIDAYLADVIACGIANGMVSPSVDPSGLRDTP